MEQKLNAIKYFAKLQNKISEEEKERKMKKKQGTKRIFTQTEDELLLFLVGLMGEKRWKEISKLIPGKSVRQCRERYKTYLKPGINLDEWTPEDDSKLKELVENIGPKWAVLTSYFPGRTDNALKNRYNVHLTEHKKPRKNAKKVQKEQPIKETLIDITQDDLPGDFTLGLEPLNLDTFEAVLDIGNPSWQYDFIGLGE